jgi:hypothetical protein
MFTVVETTVFQKVWPNYWEEEDRGEFAVHIALNANSGDVIPDSGGVRKVRWSRAGMGKSGGVRVIYYVLNSRQEIVLLTMYSKSSTDNIDGKKLKAIRDALEKKAPKG